MLDASLGFAAGVMVAASYWSLLGPAIEMAKESKTYGVEGEYAFIPVAIGFLLGAAFVFGTDELITSLGIQSPNVLLAMQSVGTQHNNKLLRQRYTLGKQKSDADDFNNDSRTISHISNATEVPNVCTRVESSTIDGIPLN